MCPRAEACRTGKDEVVSQQDEAQGRQGEHGEEHFVPRGTFLFVMVMLLGYALYWGYMWLLVVQRA
jgi:hypothetical protein